MKILTNQLGNRRNFRRDLEITLGKAQLPDVLGGQDDRLILNKKYL